MHFKALRDLYMVCSCICYATVLGSPSTINKDGKLVWKQDGKPWPEEASVILLSARSNDIINRLTLEFPVIPPGFQSQKKSVVLVLHSIFPIWILIEQPDALCLNKRIDLFFFSPTTIREYWLLRLLPGLLNWALWMKKKDSIRLC